MKNLKFWKVKSETDCVKNNVQGKTKLTIYFFLSYFFLLLFYLGLRIFPGKWNTVNINNWLKL